MTYRFSDFEWDHILLMYQKYHGFFDPVSRSSMAKLIQQLGTSHTVTTLDQAKTLVTLLSADPNRMNHSEEQWGWPEDTPSEIKMAEMEQESEIDPTLILRIIEQLRIFIARIFSENVEQSNYLERGRNEK